MKEDFLNLFPGIPIDSQFSLFQSHHPSGPIFPERGKTSRGKMYCACIVEKLNHMFVFYLFT
jgi:hypothetical protein